MFPQTTTTVSALDFSFWFIFWISVALLLGVTAVMLLFVFRYSKTRHPVAENIEGNMWLEIVWTLTPTVLVLSMFYFGWSGDYIARKAPADAMPVNVYGQMWSWQFEYPNGKTTDELYAPLNRPVKLFLHSRDVNHGFFIAAFGLKQDVVPGRENTLWFEATQPGIYDIQCSLYCGTRHSAMLSKVHVIPQEEFDKWYNTISLTRELSGEQILRSRGCLSCHSTDGSRLVGPSLKGLYGKKELILVRGAEKLVTVDEDYLKTAILNPQTKTVKGYPAGKMPGQEGLIKPEELQKLVDYLKDLR